ncbi:hypothetical protein [Ralstonia pseudosolanacearum]
MVALVIALLVLAATGSNVKLRAL